MSRKILLIIAVLALCGAGASDRAWSSTLPYLFEDFDSLPVGAGPSLTLDGLNFLGVQVASSPLAASPSQVLTAANESPYVISGYFPTVLNTTYDFVTCQVFNTGPEAAEITLRAYNYATLLDFDSVWLSPQAGARLLVAGNAITSFNFVKSGSHRWEFAIDNVLAYTEAAAWAAYEDAKAAADWAEAAADRAEAAAAKAEACLMKTSHTPLPASVLLLGSGLLGLVLAGGQWRRPKNPSRPRKEV